MSTARVYTAHTRTKSGNGWLPSEAMQGAFHLRRFASFLRRKSSENSQPATDADERRFSFNVKTPHRRTPASSITLTRKSNWTE